MLEERKQADQRMTDLEQTVTDLEDIQHTHIELTDLRRAKVNDKLESLNHKLHSLSNLYMAMEEKLNELAEFSSQIKVSLDDLRKGIKSLGD